MMFGWKYGKLYLTYLKNVDLKEQNLNFGFITEKMKKDKDITIIDDLNMNNNIYISNWMNKYKNYSFIGESSKNLGILLHDRNRAIDRDILKNFLATSEHEMLFFKFNKQVQYYGHIILGKKEAKLNSIMIIEQILNGRKIKYNKKEITGKK